MSSFHKIGDTRANLSGTKIKNNLPHLSSGIPCLDHVIGGGLPLGSLFVVEEDILGNYSRILCKYFLAEGIICQHGLFIAMADDDPGNLIKELPQVSTVPADEEVKNVTAEIDKMKIAWRYESLNQVESSFGSNASFGHHFDLSKHIDSETIKKSNITLCKLDSMEDHAEYNGFKNGIYYNLLRSISEKVSTEDYQRKHNKNILRICIPSLGSPMWMAKDCDDERGNFGQDLLKFMYCLRTIIRDTNAMAFITVPSHLFHDHNHIINRLLYSVDNAVKIESFAGSDRETNPVYKDYHGLFHITKLSSVYSLVPFVPPSLDLAFKLKRKKFLIEKLHLPPELQESSEREQDDITTPVPSSNCGGFKKKDIDF